MPGRWIAFEPPMVRESSVDLAAPAVLAATRSTALQNSSAEPTTKRLTDELPPNGSS